MSHRVTEEELRAVEEHKALATRCGVSRVGDLEDGTGMLCSVPFAVLEELERLRSSHSAGTDNQSALHAAEVAQAEAEEEVEAIGVQLAAVTKERDRLDKCIDRKDEQMAELQEALEAVTKERDAAASLLRTRRSSSPCAIGYEALLTVFEKAVAMVEPYPRTMSERDAILRRRVAQDELKIAIAESGLMVPNVTGDGK